MFERALGLRNDGQTRSLVRTPAEEQPVWHDVSMARVDAAVVWKKYSDRPGSKHIATEFAIAGIVKWVEILKPRRVLEIGPGIGTLTEALIRTLTTLHGDDFKLV